MRRVTIVSIGGAIAAIVAICLALYMYSRPTVLRVAVTRDGDDQAVLAAAAQEFAQDREPIRLKLVVVDSLAESSTAFEEERVDLAIVRSDIAMPPSSHTVLIMHKNAAILLTPAQSGIRSVDDLKGRRVGMLQGARTGMAGDRGLLDTALAQYDVPAASVRMIPLTLAEASKALERKEIDAVFTVGAPGSQGLRDVVSAFAQAGRGQLAFIPIAEAKAIAQRSPHFESIEVLRGAFGGAQPKPAASFETLGASTRLVAHHSLSNDVVGELTELLLAARPKIAVQLPAANRIEAPPKDKAAALPVHAGALAYLDDEEQSFFDKYSDFIYLGAMFLSLIGTGLATLATRFSRRQSADIDRILSRLLEIVKTARSVERLDALDEFEREADELLALALALDSNHGLSGNRLTATSLALTQVRHAIAERRQSVSPAVRAPFAPRIVRE
ncbi:TAXI family TRAP transporter solute-binding subunit [Methylocapsa aurea]|uniref:TAXI family TRAP transporter solute-binding subunit n=1 Tax=Methylocapsa aurea TaxID=663610 RepID=UPI000691B4B5|nr:TAXI family TRAP transporter solute-binding subunit [Methylocapsa aurea]